MALQREALEMRRRLYAGVDQPDLASSLNNVGASLLALGDRVTGVALISEALDIRLDGAVIDATPIERFASSLASTSASLDRPRLFKIRGCPFIDRTMVQVSILFTTLSVG